MRCSPESFRGPVVSNSDPGTESRGTMRIDFASGKFYFLAMTSWYQCIRWAICVLLLITGQGRAADFPHHATVLDLVGHRADKNSVGHGRNVALYTGTPSKFYFATHQLGSVFSAVDGTTIEWFPDHVLLVEATNRN